MSNRGTGVKYMCLPCPRYVDCWVRADTVGHNNMELTIAIQSIIEPGKRIWRLLPNFVFLREQFSKPCMCVASAGSQYVLSVKQKIVLLVAEEKNESFKNMVQRTDISQLICAHFWSTDVTTQRPSQLQYLLSTSCIRYIIYSPHFCIRV